MLGIPNSATGGTSVLAVGFLSEPRMWEYLWGHRFNLQDSWAEFSQKIWLSMLSQMCFYCFYKEYLRNLPESLNNSFTLNYNCLKTCPKVEMTQQPFKKVETQNAVSKLDVINPTKPLSPCAFAAYKETFLHAGKMRKRPSFPSHVRKTVEEILPLWEPLMLCAAVRNHRLAQCGRGLGGCCVWQCPMLCTAPSSWSMAELIEEPPGRGRGSH